jgi:hypothetical protein
MIFRSLVFLLALSAVACGETAFREADVVDSGSTDGTFTHTDGPSDGGLLACGDAFCDPAQLCVISGSCLGEAVTDAGVCPDATHYFSGECIVDPAPPYCVSPTSSPIPCADGSVSAPLPSGSSRICYILCA